MAVVVVVTVVLRILVESHQDQELVMVVVKLVEEARLTEAAVELVQLIVVVMAVLNLLAELVVHHQVLTQLMTVKLVAHFKVDEVQLRVAQQAVAAVVATSVEVAVLGKGLMASVVAAVDLVMSIHL